MADIYIALSAFANPPTKKTRRETMEAFPQITGVTTYSDPFEFPPGVPRAPGFIVHTSNPDPDPDEAAIIAFATSHDGSADPDVFGVPIPLVDVPGDLPAQPPNIPDDVALLAAVANPPSLWAWARGAWRGPIEPT